MNEVYKLELTTEELAALSAMLLISNGTMGGDKGKIAIGLMTTATVPNEYIVVCGKINALAGAGLYNLRGEEMGVTG